MNFRMFTPRMLIAFGLLLVVTGVLAAPASYRLRVDGLACPFCAYGIEKKLNAVPGVERVETNIKEGVVVVTTKDGAVINEAAAKQAVEEAGFTLEGFERVSSEN